MKKLFLFLTALFAMLLVANTADGQQRRYRGDIRYTDTRVERVGDMLRISGLIDLSELHLGRQQMVIITPEIVSPDGRRSNAFDPVVVAGSVRYKMIKRGEKFDTEHFGVEPSEFVRHTNNPRRDANFIDYAYEVRFEEWMRDSRLVINELVTQCANCEVQDNQFLVMERILPPAFVPEYNVAYLLSPTQDGMRRSESYSSMLNFVVGKYDIRRDFKDNADQLARIDNIFNEINNDKSCTVSEVTIVGFASPDGNFNSNMTLSKNRAHSLANYISKNHNVPVETMDISWKGEDWDGVQRAISGMEFEGKDEVMDIISNQSDIDVRKNMIQALNGGRTWRYLLDNVFPPLRRNDFTIFFPADPFELSEARQIILTNPERLTLNDKLAVARSYTRGTSEFRRTIDAIIRLHPDSEAARVNAAATEIENGSLDAAARRLSGINTPEALNNMGVIHALRQDYTRAEDMFRRAAAAGNATASENLRQMEMWKQNR